MMDGGTAFDNIEKTKDDRKGRPYGGGGSGFDVDFNILTAFIRLGRAGPVGAGCPPYYYLNYFLTLTRLKKIFLFS